MILDPNAPGSNIFVVVYFLVYLWDVFFVGGLILKRFCIPLNSRVEKKIFEFALGNLTFSLIFHYLGIFHLLYSQILFALYLIPLLFLLKRTLTGRLELFVVSGIRGFFTNRWKTGELLMFAFLLFVFGPLIPQLFIFPSAWDVLAYHLTLPKVFLQTHFFLYYDWLPNTLFPIGIESLFSFGEIVGEPRVANFIVFSFLIALTIYMLYGLRWLLPKRVLFVAFFLFVFKDVLFTAVPVAPFVDFPLAFYTLLISVTLIKYLKSPQWRLLLLLLAFSFFTFLIKYALGLVFISSLAAILGIWGIFNRDYLKKAIAMTSRPQKIYFTAVLAIFSLPIIYWLGRNYIYTNNPIYPFFNPLWNKIAPVAGFDQADYNASIANMRGGSLSIKMTIKTVLKFMLGRTVDFSGGKEVFAAGVTLIFAAAAIFNKDRMVKYVAGFGLLSTLPIYWLAGFPSSRYSLASTAVLALAASVVFFGLFRRPFPWIKLPTMMLFAIAMIVQFYPTAQKGYEAFLQSFDRNAQGMISSRVAVLNAYGQDNLQNITYTNRILDQERDRVLTVFDNRLYYFKVPAEYAVQSADGVFTNKRTKDIGEIYQNIKDRKITHLFINRNWGVYGNLRTDLFDPFVATYLEPISTASGTTLYKLK